MEFFRIAWPFFFFSFILLEISVSCKKKDLWNTAILSECAYPDIWPSLAPPL